MDATGFHESVRQEIILGTNESPLVEVDFDNSIVNRLDQLLETFFGILACGYHGQEQQSATRKRGR